MSNTGLHHMYYLAILCPQEVEKTVRSCKLWMKEQFGCTVALKSPAHITLIPPFWLNSEREPALREAVASFTSGLDKPVIGLDGFSHFNRRVLFVQVNANAVLHHLQQQVSDYFNLSFGDAIRRDQHPFHPHITIANRDMRPAHFEKAWPHFSGKALRESFTASAISLCRLDAGQWQVIAEKAW